MGKFWAALGGVKIGLCLMVMSCATVLLCVGTLDQSGWIYMATFGVVTAVGGNLAAMGIHAFGKNKQGNGPV